MSKMDIRTIYLVTDILGIITGIVVALTSSPYGIPLALAFSALFLKDF